MPLDSQLASAFIEAELLTTPEAQELLPAYPLVFGTEYRALMIAKVVPVLALLADLT